MNNSWRTNHAGSGLNLLSKIVQKVANNNWQRRMKETQHYLGQGKIRTIPPMPNRTVHIISSCNETHNLSVKLTSDYFHFCATVNQRWELFCRININQGKMSKTGLRTAKNSYNSFIQNQVCFSNPVLNIWLLIGMYENMILSIREDKSFSLLRL